MFIERRAQYRAKVVLRSDTNRAFQETSLQTYQSQELRDGRAVEFITES